MCGLSSGTNAQAYDCEETSDDQPYQDTLKPRSRTVMCVLIHNNANDLKERNYITIGWQALRAIIRDRPITFVAMTSVLLAPRRLFGIHGFQACGRSAH